MVHTGEGLPLLRMPRVRAPTPPPHTHPTTITHIRGRAQYSSWALALSLKQAGQELVTFPDVMFQAHRWARQGLG